MTLVEYRKAIGDEAMDFWYETSLDENRHVIIRLSTIVRDSG